jgi:hypothetical protein
MGQETPLHGTMHCRNRGNRHHLTQAGQRTFQQLLSIRDGARDLLAWWLAFNRLSQFTLSREMLEETD